MSYSFQEHKNKWTVTPELSLCVWLPNLFAL